MMWLSILLPSSRPDDLLNLLESLRRNTSNWNDIEIIFRFHNDKIYKGFHICGSESKNFKFLYRSSEATVTDLGYDCYKYATGEWILGLNDDMLCETPNWDVELRRITNIWKDRVVLLWPNDMIFQEKFACFPIVQKEIIDKIRFYPAPPYKKYKIDDELFNAYPAHRKIYLPQIVFRHLNDKGVHGYKTADGRVYPNDSEAMEHDQKLYDSEITRRERLAREIRAMISGLGGER